MNDIYTFTIPIFIKSLGGLEAVLRKAENFVKEKGLAEKDFLAERLAPDMFPLVKQVQVASDNAKGAAARLSGSEAPKFEDREETFEALYSRIAKTVEYLKGITPASFEGAHERKAELPYFPGKHMTGFDYAREYALPNFFFHVTIAYAIIRHKGVDVGKADYTNGLPLKDNE